MRSFFVTAFALTLGFAIHCGGRVDVNPDGGSCNAGDVCSTDGAQCSFQTTYCNQPATETCTCQNGQWACPVMAGDCPVDACPASGVNTGDVCFTKGLECQAMQIPQCTDVWPMCTCNGEQFQCPIVDCPVPMCPPPSEVQGGMPCNEPGSSVCSDALGGTCKCMGSWACSDPVDAGAPD